MDYIRAVQIVRFSEMRLSPSSYVILGLIGLRGPSTPYQLKRAVGRSIAYFWPFKHAQLYSEPERLAVAGLLIKESESGGRNRKIYSLTDEGRLALSRWLAEPPDDPYELRDMAILQLQFSQFTSRENIISLANQQLKLHRERLATYDGITARFADSLAGKRRIAPLRFGVLLEQAYITFWEEIAANPPEA
jgi:PadR family transcriptional regulator, regulatory protein AphA